MRPDVTPLLAISGMGGDLAREAVNIELTNAIQLNDLLVIQDMVQGGLVDGGLALARVAQVGGTGEMLRLLLQMGAKPDATDEFGRTAIMLAVSRRDKQLTELLLSAGANVEGIGGTYNGRTALMQAACSGATEMVTLLLANGADPAATDRYGRNVIQQAAVMRREDTVRILEKHMKEQARRQAQGSAVPQEPASRGLFGFFGGQSAPAPPRKDLGLPADDARDVRSSDERSDADEKLWLSIFRESSPVPGRPEVFKWRGRRLLQPAMADDGMCVILDESTREVIYRGKPPARSLTAAAPGQQHARTVPGGGGGGGGAAAAAGMQSAARITEPEVRVTSAQGLQGGGSGGRGGGGRGEPRGGGDEDADIERRLWRAIISESSPVPGRTDVFKWRGRVLQQPRLGGDGVVVIIEVQPLLTKLNL